MNLTLSGLFLQIAGKQIAPRRAGKLVDGMILALAMLPLSVFGKSGEADLKIYEGMPENQALVQAALEGDLPAVRHYLKAGPNLNATVDWYGQKTALAGAAVRNHVEVMKLLLDAGADPNYKPTKGWTAWESAIRRGRKEAADLLIERGAVVEERTLAAYYNDTEYLEPILKAELATLPFDTIATWNEIAMANNHVELFRLTLQAGKKHPKVPTWNFPWESAVITAIARGHKEVMEQFIELCRNGDLYRFQDGPARIGDAAREVPGMKEWLEARGFKVPEYNVQEELIDASGKGDLFKMKQLLDAGVKPNYNGGSGWSPVVKAANSNKIDAVKLLLARGGDPNSVKSPGANWSALTLCENPKIADVLFDAGADINAKLGGGSHIISYPTYFGHTAMIKWFVEKGVDVKTAKCEDPTLLFRAGNAEIAKILIDAGVDVKVRDERGRTALHEVAEKKNSAPMVKVLLEAGADPNAADVNGRTPLMLASSGDSVELLLKYGANPNAKTVDGQGITAMSGHNVDISRLKELETHGFKLSEKDILNLMRRAASQNEFEIMEFLLSRGADANAKIPMGDSGYFDEPIMSAAMQGHLDVLEVLLKHGGKPETGMGTALRNYRNEVVKLLWKNGARNIPESVYLMSQKARIEAIQGALAKEGAKSVASKDSLSHPFTYACFADRIDVVQSLLPSYRSDSVTLENGMNEAAYNGAWQILDLLVKNGVPVTVETIEAVGVNCNPYEWEPLKAENYAKSMQVLIASGALKNRSSEEKRKILASAVYTRQPGSNPEVVRQLLQEGLDPREKGSAGKSVVDAFQEVRVLNGNRNVGGPRSEVLTLLGIAIPAGN